MGWAKGSIVCENIWNRVRDYVPEEDRISVLADIMVVLYDLDWDTEDEVEDLWPEATFAIQTANLRYQYRYAAKETNSDN